MKASKVVPHVLSALTIIALVLGLTLHASTYFGVDPRELSQTLWYGLQLSSALAFIPALLFLNRGGPADISRPKTAYQKALAIGFLIFFVYAFFNFFYTSLVLNEGASPAIINDQYVLLRHGAVVRILGRGEFIKHEMYEARENSGHWMVLYDIALAAIYQFFRRRFTPTAQG
jgi:hypothetical protein